MSLDETDLELHTTDITSSAGKETQYVYGIGGSLILHKIRYYILS
jgi:hypothetical protein